MKNEKPTYEELEKQIAELKKQNEILKLSENSNKISDARYRKLVGNIEDVIVIIDSEGFNKYKSPNIENYFGWKPEDVVGKSTFENVHTDDLEFAQKFMETLISDPNVVKTAEIRYKCKDGSYKWIEFTCCNLLHDPEINGLLGNYHDITERKQAEEELIRQEEKFHSIFAKNSAAIAIINSDTTISMVNEAYCKLTGYTQEEVEGTSWTKQIPPDDLERLKEYNLLRFTNPKEAPEQYEFKIIRKDGIIRNAMISVSVIASSKTIIASFIDVTERKQAEEELKESEANLKAIIENSIESIWSIDTNYKIQYVNEVFAKAFENTFGATLSKGVDLLELLPELLRPLWKQRYDRAFNNEHFIFLDKVDVGDSAIYIEVAMNPILVDDKVVGASFYGKDISVQKNYEIQLIAAKEKAEESDRLKSAFLANMSHEIRTPMNGILGFADFLKEPYLTGEEQQKYIGIIEKSGARMLNIIDDIVSISKIESGQMEVNIQESNINEQIEYIYTFFKSEIEGKGLQFSFRNTLPLREAIIITDPEKVYSILTNLVKNAAKYSEKGSIEFGYNLKKDSDPAELEFYVKDTGIGIPKDRQEAIFERFIQADVADKMARQGTGLGLSISKAYVEMLDGKIWMESKLGKGSVFYFTLPYQTETIKENSAKNEILPPVEVIPINKFKILIVEDDEASAMLISISIQKFGNEIITAKTGTEAVEVCLKNPDVDFVLMDIRLPGMDGYEATRQIRKFNKDIIIIAQTAYALGGAKEKAIAAGCDDYMSKPIKADELKQIISKYMMKQ